jgi:hypothetical protein
VPSCAGANNVRGVSGPGSNRADHLAGLREPPATPINISSLLLAGAFIVAPMSLATAHPLDAAYAPQPGVITVLWRIIAYLVPQSD